MSSWFIIQSLYISYFVLDTLNVATAKAFDFAAELKIPVNLRIIKHSEAIDDGDGATGHFNHLIRFQRQKCLMTNGQD